MKAIKHNSNTLTLTHKRKPRTDILRQSLQVESLENRRLMAAWSLQAQVIGLDKATANYPAINGSGETVVLIDRGVDYNHPALGGGFGNKVIDMWNFDNGTRDAMPYDGNDAHGTGSAGAVAGNQRIVNGVIEQGVAPGLKIIALKAQGTWEEKQAFQWVIANRARYNIVGVNFVDPWGTTDPNQFVYEMSVLKSQGVFITNPVGNYGPGNAYPKASNDYYSIGSSTMYNQVSTFSPRGSSISLLAPSDNINVAWYWNGIHGELPSYGTSWSGPQVLGAAALVHQVNPAFSTDQIMQIMRDSATWISDSYSGVNYPQLNVNAAIGLAYQRSGAVTPPVVIPPVVVPPVVVPPVVVPPVVTPPVVTPPTGAKGLPFKGTPFSTNTPISASFYDAGGEGVGYHKITNFNESKNTAFRGDNVGVAWTVADGGGGFVGWTHSSEWLTYSINIPASGGYSLQARVADPHLGASYHYEIDGQVVGGQQAIPNTGAWQTYQTVAQNDVWIGAGNHVLKVVIDSNDASGYAGNFLSFTVTNGGAGTTPPPATIPPAATNAPAAPNSFSIFAGAAGRNQLAFFDNATSESNLVIERCLFSGGVYSTLATLTGDAGTGWKY